MAERVTSMSGAAAPTIDDLPAELLATVGDVTWAELGASGSHGTRASNVFEGACADGSVLYLKTAAPLGPTDGAALLRDEHDRLQWLGGRLPVPAVRHWSVDESSGNAFLVTAAMPGSPAASHEHRGDAEALIRALADGLRLVHELPVDGCPFDGRLPTRLRDARTRVEAGLVDQDDFEPAYRRYEPARLLELLEQSRPDGDEDLVITHGDATLDNLLLDRGRVVGYVDVGRAGVADRYLDLAVMARDLATAVSPHALGPFFDAYGIELADVRKVDFYVLLDEFF